MLQLKAKGIQPIDGDHGGGARDRWRWSAWVDLEQANGRKTKEGDRCVIEIFLHSSKFPHAGINKCESRVLCARRRGRGRAPAQDDPGSRNGARSHAECDD